MMHTPTAHRWHRCSPRATVGARAAARWATLATALPLALLFSGHALAAAAASSVGTGGGGGGGGGAQLWPLPRVSHGQGRGEPLAVDPATFTWATSGACSAQARQPCSATLARAMKRYAAICFPPAARSSADAGAANELAPPGADTGAGTARLSGLEVVVRSQSEALGIGTSENYTLTIAQPVATLAADTVYGAMRGLETFAQLLVPRDGTPGHRPQVVAGVETALSGNRQRCKEESQLCLMELEKGT